MGTAHPVTGFHSTEMSVSELMCGQNLTRTAHFVADVLGPRAIADTGQWGTYARLVYGAGVLRGLSQGRRGCHGAGTRVFIKIVCGCQVTLFSDVTT